MFERTGNNFIVNEIKKLLEIPIDKDENIFDLFELVMCK